MTDQQVPDRVPAKNDVPPAPHGQLVPTQDAPQTSPDEPAAGTQ